MLGFIVLKCKGEECKFAANFGFVFDIEDYADKFQDTELSCPSCKLKALYTRHDLTLIPAKE